MLVHATITIISFGTDSWWLGYGMLCSGLINDRQTTEVFYHRWSVSIICGAHAGSVTDVRTSIRETETGKEVLEVRALISDSWRVAYGTY